MATNDPQWSYGKSELYNSSGSTTDPQWSYGQSSLKHEFAAASGQTVNVTLLSAQGTLRSSSVSTGAVVPLSLQAALANLPSSTITTGVSIVFGVLNGLSQHFTVAIQTGVVISEDLLTASGDLATPTAISGVSVSVVQQTVSGVQYAVTVQTGVSLSVLSLSGIGSVKTIIVSVSGEGQSVTVELLSFTGEINAPIITTSTGYCLDIEDTLDALKVILEKYLPSYLDAIDTEKGDDITLDDPAGYYISMQVDPTAYPCVMMYPDPTELKIGVDMYGEEDDLVRIVALIANSEALNDTSMEETLNTKLARTLRGIADTLRAYPRLTYGGTDKVDWAHVLEIDYSYPVMELENGSYMKAGAVDTHIRRYEGAGALST